MPLPILAFTLAALSLAGAVSAAEIARYEVRLDVTWTAESHPQDYPEDAHFSRMLGTTHGESYKLFVEGGMATPGLEMMAERGRREPLDAEFDAATSGGEAGVLFASEGLASLPGTMTAAFEIEAAHPYVSLATMIAPSPDWFTGVSALPLLRNGEWLDSLTLDLFGWDSGTDSGTTYTAPNADTQPREPIRRLEAPPFLGENGPKPVGTVTFTRKD